MPQGLAADETAMIIRRIGSVLALILAVVAMVAPVVPSLAGLIAPPPAFSRSLLVHLPGVFALAGALACFVLAPFGVLLLLVAGLAMPFVLGVTSASLIVTLVMVVAAGLAMSGYYLALSRAIDAFNSAIGRWISWLVVAAVLVSAINAIVRKTFDTSSNAFLEMQWVMFSMVFLFCSPWTLIHNEHVRIDIVNHLLPLRLRQSIDLIGHLLFLMPFALLMIYYGAPYLWSSLMLNEQSFSAGGLPQWLAKSLIVIGFFLLALQGISETIKRIVAMRGLAPEPLALP